MILLVSTKIKHADGLCLDFWYAGVLSHAVKPSEIASEIGPRYRAAIVLCPHELADTDTFISKLRSYDPELSVFAISDTPVSERYTGVFAPGTPVNLMMSKIIRADRYANAGQYRLAGLNFSFCSLYTKFFTAPFPLTRTEAMVLKFLMRAYPLYATANEILTYSFKKARTPEPGAVRTHVSSINRKFQERFGRPLIVSSAGNGYIILTPEYAEEHEEYKAVLRMQKSL